MLKVSKAPRFLGGLVVALLLLGVLALWVASPAPSPPSRPSKASPAATVVPSPPLAARAREDCGRGPTAAAQANAASLQTLAWAPFRRPETGWETYAPLIAHELGTTCPADTPGFAAALAAWQALNRLPADGIMTPEVFAPMRDAIEMRRPFEALTRHGGACPAPPPEASLATAGAAEGYSGMVIQLRPAALAAYRRLARAARAEDPEIAADPRNLTIFSGYRGPQADAARCARAGDCGGPGRANCSAHRTGLALDVYVGQAPGFPPDSSADANRLYMSRTPTYRWLVANAARFGFLNYPFEPWHWEWTGEQP